jgi:hypothetical protein
MDSLHKIITRFGVGLFALFFAFVTTYVPHTANPVPEAEAKGLFGVVFDAPNFAVNSGNLISNSATAGATAVSANADVLRTSKDTTLDGIAWALAKSVVSEITSSIVDWINNGFQGSPSFVEDFEGLLINAADKTAGAYLQELGGDFSVLCDPFKLDVRIALAVSYQTTRNGESACTLSGAVENLQNFLDGSFEEGGGWDAWFEVTANPTKYTPYGSFLEVQQQATARILNSKNQMVKELDFGGGFLSAKVCQQAEGANGSREKCTVSTPGKVIQEALTFQLSTGQRSLIEADEINEIISALFGQLAKQAIVGAAGLLGLSDDTGYTTYTYDQYGATTSVSYGVRVQTTVNEHNLGEALRDASQLEVYYRDQALLALPRLIAFASTSSSADEFRKSLARDEINVINRLLLELNGQNGLIIRINGLIYRFNLLPNPEQDTAITKKERQNIIKEFSLLKLHNKQLVDNHILSWDRIVRQIAGQSNDAYEDRVMDRASDVLEDAFDSGPF